MTAKVGALPPNMQNKIQLTESKLIELDSPCWIWIGAITSRGYGSVAYQSRTWSTHKLAYVLLVGTVPDGLTIDHLCLNKTCCNPAHLEPVTNAENLRRAGVNNLAVYGSAFPHFDRLSEYVKSTPHRPRSSADWARLRRLAVSGRELA